MANKIYAQYKNSPDFFAWSEIPRTITADIKEAAISVRDSWDIDNNSGDALDVVGRIIGRDRSYIASVKFNVVECNSVGDVEFGDSFAQMSVVYATEDSDLSDKYYRLLLKSTIAKNNSDGTIDSILSAVRIIAPDIGSVRLIDGEDMTFSIEYYTDTDPIVRDLLINGNIVPTPQGVRFIGFLELTGAPVMNTSGDFEFGDSFAQMTGFIGV